MSFLSQWNSHKITIRLYSHHKYIWNIIYFFSQWLSIELIKKSKQKTEIISKIHNGNDIWDIKRKKKPNV